MSHGSFAYILTLIDNGIFDHSETARVFGSTAVRQALQTSPHNTQSVLSFFFGVDYQNSNEVDVQLRKGVSLQEMVNLWYAGGPEYDKVCEDHFQDAVRTAGKGHLLDSAGLSQVDQVVAQMILCDQFSRNVFWGLPEAFAYEDQALSASRKVTDSVLKTPPVLSGEVHPPYLAFSITALMHSESLSDHERAISVLKFAQEKYSTSSKELQKNWDYQMQFELDHKAVIDRFGRYPHRNGSKGRESTAAEEQWLADVDNLPGWAKSQMAK